jgi:hypothetical protein
MRGFDLIAAVGVVDELSFASIPDKVGSESCAAEIANRVLFSTRKDRRPAGVARLDRRLPQECGTRPVAGRTRQIDRGVLSAFPGEERPDFQGG